MASNSTGLTIVETGAVGINFEDQIIGKEKARYSIEEQCKRIKAVKEAIKESLLPSMFINARTDIFLQKDIVNSGEFEARNEAKLMQKLEPMGSLHQA